MMMLGRSGHDKHWCLYCRWNKSDWRTCHRENQVTENTSDNFDMWKTKDITAAVLEREQKILQLKATGKTDKQIPNLCPIIGAKEALFWPFIPVERSVLPDLRVLLCVGNKVMNNCWDIAYDRIESFPDELVAVQNVSILYAIALKKVEEELMEAVTSLKQKQAARKHLNAAHKRKLADAEKLEKEFLKKEEVTCGAKKKELETKLQKMKNKLSEVQDEEETAVEKFGKAHDIKNTIEKNTLRRHRVQVTAHHGVDLESNCIRQLMSKGDDTFSEITDFL